MSYSTSDLPLLREVVESAEVRLSAQLTSALAADQRALVLAGFLATSIVALISGAVALLLMRPPATTLGVIAIAVALALAVALGLIVYTARPVDWMYPGTRPKDWLKDIQRAKPEKDWLAERAADCERKAARNARLLSSHSRFMLAALILVALALGTGAISSAAALAWRP